MNFREYKLGEIADFNKSSISKSEIIKDIIYLDTGSITENVISDTITLDITEAPSRAQRKVEHHTIIYSTVRPRLKHYGLLENPRNNLIVSTGFTTIDLKEECKGIIDPRFLYLLLTQPIITEYIGNIADTAVSAYPSINSSDISTLTFNFPDFYIQNTIADLWESYDKKITLNRAINHNLEALAKQLYDYWFVQFDFPNEEGKPYKSSGGKMVWNEKLKREIPEGWDADALNTWLEIKSGFPFKSETYRTTGRYKVITIKNVQDGELVTSGCDFVEEIPSRAKEYIALKIGDRLISLTGNCGRLCVVCEENLLLNQRVGLLSCNSLYLEYLYNLLNSQPMKMEVDNLANGAAQANLSPVELCKTICAMPQEDTLLEYNRKANVFRLALVKNNQEIAALTKQRDELLPLLMNGQVSVNYDLCVHFIILFYLV